MRGKLFTGRRLVWRGRGRYFVRLFLSYLLVVAVPVGCMGSIWYFMVKAAEERQALKQEENHLELLTQEIGNLYEQIEQNIIGLEYGSVYKNYMLEQSPVHILHIIDELSKIKRMNNAVYSVYFYDQSRGRIYREDGKGMPFEEFYDTNWLEQLSAESAVQHLVPRRILDADFAAQVQQRGWERIYPDKEVLSVVSDGNMSAYFVVNLDIQSMVEQLYQKYVTDERALYLTTETGQILYASGAGREAEQPEMPAPFPPDGSLMSSWSQGGALFFARQVGYEPLYCVEQLPASLIYANSEGYKALILGLIAVIAVSMVVLTAIVVRKLYRPIGELYHELGAAPEQTRASEDEISAITRTFHEMNRNQEDTLLEMEKQREILHSETLRMFLNRVITQEDFLKENPALFPTGSAENYRFLVCRAGRYEPGAETETTRGHLKEVLNTYLAARGPGIFTEYQYGIYVALFSSGQDAKLADILYQALSEMAEGQIYCAISQDFTCAQQLREIFAESDARARQKQFFEYDFEQTAEQPVPAETAELKITTFEARLIRDILLEDCADITRQLQQLQSMLRQVGDVEKAVDIAQRILLTVDKECRTREEQGGMTLEASALRSQGTLSGMIDLLQEAFTRACGNVRSNTGNENAYYKKACTYIRKNYAQNMNVSDVADALEISYAYLSKIFKSQSESGETLLDYLNRIRIAKAKELLLSTELQLSEIAEQVGYNNAQSLQRFFKKYENVTPGDYRRMNRQ